MKPRIDGTQFGSITIDGSVFEHDVILRLSGKVKKRKKKLSKRLYGTSHTISLDEAKHVYEDGAKRLIVGAGQHGNVAPVRRGRPTISSGRGAWSNWNRRATATRAWNSAKGAVIGLFHVTC